MPTDDERDAERVDADLASEEDLGRPLHYPSPEAAIAAMQLRLADLQRRLDAVHARGDDPLEPPLVKAIRDTKARLADYQAQLDGQN